MLKNYASLVHSCRPLTIAETDSDSGFRVGGNPPKGVSPKTINSFTRYFMTIPLDEAEGLELSLFTSFVYDDWEDPAFLSNGMCIMHSQDSPLVQFVVHGAAPRQKRSRLACEYPGRALQMGRERVDNARQESDLMWTHHKIGGHPFFYHARPDVLDGAARLLDDGFIHLLQMTSPGFEDALAEGDWPLVNHMFHVFAKDTGEGPVFHYIWA